jgi:hypothetical protein
MPAPLLQALPYLLAVGAAAFLSGSPIRFGVVGISLVALASSAAARVGAGNPSFQLINGAMLYGGLLLFTAAFVLSLQRGRATAGAVAPGPAIVQATPAPRWRQWAMPLLLALLLLPSLWFTVTVAGPDAWSLQGLRDAPFSEAGETLLTAMLLPASLVLAGVWPFGFVAGGPRLAPLAALLLLAVVVPMAGQGLEHWRSLYAGWLVLAAFIASATANWPRVMACAGLFAIACGTEGMFWAGTALTMIGSLLSLRPGTRGPLVRLAYLAAGACGMAALRATLATEVVYSVLMLLAVAVGVLRQRFDSKREA